MQEGVHADIAMQGLHLAVVDIESQARTAMQGPAIFEKHVIPIIRPYYCGLSPRCKPRDSPQTLVVWQAVTQGYSLLVQSSHFIEQGR